MDLIVIVGVVSSLLVILVTLLSKNHEKNKRIEEVKNRAIQRHLNTQAYVEPKVQVQPKIIKHTTEFKARAEIRNNKMQSEMSKDEIISALLSDSNVIGDAELIELWAPTDPAKLKE